MPLVSTRSSASRTRTPAITRSGAISASGTSTKARSNRCGCGKIRSAIGEDEIVIGEKVDVDRARSPAAFAGTVAPERAFALLGARQQFMRRERGGNANHGVDEWRLVGDAPGRRPVIGRARVRRTAVAIAEHDNGPIESRTHIADIAAKRDECLGHGHGRERCRARVTMTPTSSKVAAIGACGLRTVTRMPRTCGKRSSTASATAPAAASTRR